MGAPPPSEARGVLLRAACPESPIHFLSFCSCLSQSPEIKSGEIQATVHTKPKG